MFRASAPGKWREGPSLDVYKRQIIHSLPGFSPVPDGSDPDLLLLEGKTENAKAPGKACLLYTSRCV